MYAAKNYYSITISFVNMNLWGDQILFILVNANDLLASVNSLQRLLAHWPVDLLITRHTYLNRDLLEDCLFSCCLFKTKLEQCEFPA